MKLYEIIFVDFDGVLAQWEPSADKIPFDRETQPNEFWGAMDHEFYSNLEPYEGVLEFIKKVKKFGDEVKFLTGAPMTPGAWSGKAEWLMKLYNDKWAMKDLFVCASLDKRLLSQPGRLLIDDTKRNCDMWVEYGGDSICHTSISETIKLLEIAKEHNSTEVIRES